MSARTRERGQTGVVAVEFALSAMVILLTVFFAVDIARIGLAQVKLEIALRRAALWGSYGQTLTAMTRENSIKTRLVSEAQQFGITVSTANVRVCPGVDFNCATQSAGAPGEFFSIEVTNQQLPVIFPQFWWRVLSTQGIRGKITMQNEYVF